jgi:hypothetical protein
MASYTEMVTHRERERARAQAETTAALLADAEGDWLIERARLGEREQQAAAQRLAVGEAYDGVMAGRLDYARFEEAAIALAEAVSGVQAVAGACGGAELRVLDLRRVLARQTGASTGVDSEPPTAVDMALAHTIVDLPPLDADAPAPAEPPGGIRAWLNRHGAAGGGA